MKTLDTEKGTNYQAILQMAMGAIVVMPEGTPKTVLLALNLLCMAVVSWAIRGSGITVAQGQELLDMSKDLKKVLGEGRDG